MPTKKLTGAVIQSIKPKDDGSRVNYFDSQHTGLCLRVGRRDKTWAYHYRFNGKCRSPVLGKYVLGRTDHMDRAKAIIKASDIDNLVDQGIDPKFSKVQVTPKPSVKNPNSFERRTKQFLTWYKKTKIKPQTYRQAKRLLESDFLNSIKQIDVKQIRRGQLVDLLESMDETPVQANRLHSYLSKFFDWCWDKEFVDPSPIAGVKKRFSEKARTRNLSSDEIKRLWEACTALGYPLGDWCLFTLATGQRPGECRRLSRADLLGSIWLVEGGDPKNAERHRIPLPKIALKIVENSPVFEGDYVFSFRHGELPVSQGGKSYNLIYDTAGLEEAWHPNDLRRTFQTQCSEELDVEPHMLGVICNQLSVSKPGVSKVYNQAKWVKKKKEILDKWNDWLLELINDEKSKN